MPTAGLLYPRPKAYEALPGFLSLPPVARIASGAAERPAAESLRAALAGLTGVRPRLTDTGEPGVEIRLELQRRIQGVPDRTEGYLLDTAGSEVRLTAMSDTGLFHAGRALLGLLRRNPEGRLAVPRCCVRDWPDFPLRGFLLNAATTFADMEEVAWTIELLARNRMNLLHMNFADAVSFTLPTRRFPRLNIPPDPRHNGVYSRDDLRRMVALGRAQRVEILPGINMPGHAQHWLRQYPALRCDGPRPSPWVMCLGRERAFEMIEALFDELLPLFPHDYVHIGTDELEFEDALERVWLSWRECPHCLRRMEREGLAGPQELFYYFVRRIHRMLAERGKRLMMWNDNVDSSRPVPLPGDIRMHFWRIPRPGRGPHAGCSLNRLAARGFDVVCSPFADVYVDSHARDERLLTWTPGRRPPVHPRLRRRILGGMGCSWRGRSGYPPEYYTPPFLAMLGDRLWNREPIRNADAFARGLARHLFGPDTPEVLANLFHIEGRIVRNEAGRFEAAPGVLASLPATERAAILPGAVAALKRCAAPAGGWDPRAARALLARLRRAMER